MKAFIFCFAIIIGTIGCDKSSVDDMACIGDCLFTEVERTGTISYTNCYEQWAITFDDDDSQAIIIDPDDALKIEGLRVEVDAIFYDNDFPFLMPDPPGPIIYKIEIRSYKILD